MSLLCTIFTKTIVSETLAQTVANELSSCKEVSVVKLNTESVVPTDAVPITYLAWQCNVNAVVEELR